MLKRISVIVAAGVMAAVLCSPVFVNAEDEDYDYVFGLHFASTGGNSSSQFYDLVKTMTEIGEKEYGYRIKVKNFESEEAVIKAFMDGEIDMAKLFFEGIVKIEENGGAVYPWATFKIDDDKKTGMCLWSPKVDEKATPGNIAGKTLLVSSLSPHDYLSLREHLASLGIDKPLWKVFGGFVKITSMNSAFMALGAGKADLMWASTDQKRFMKVFFPNIYAKLKTDLCTDFIIGRGILGINKRTVNDKEIDVADDALKNLAGDLGEFAKKYPDADFVYKFLRMSKIKPMHAREDNFDHERALYARSKKNGWWDEAVYFVEKAEAGPKGPEFQVKADMPYCKKTCAAGNSECILSCLE